jgi:hypothetical protein
LKRLRKFRRGLNQTKEWRESKRPQPNICYQESYIAVIADRQCKAYRALEKAATGGTTTNAPRGGNTNATKSMKKGFFGMVCCRADS